MTSEAISNQIGSTISGNGRSDMLLIQSRSNNAVYQGMETDGTFCWVREEGDKVTHIAVREATYVKKDGTVLFEASSPSSEAIQL